MVSVIIATLDSERALVQTLAALVPGATAGLVTEVIVADGGSGDETAAVADVAGCHFLTLDGALGARLRTAAARARAPWLLFLRPGCVLDAPWTAEVGRFVHRPAGDDRRAAVFRRATSSPAQWRHALALLVAAIRSRAAPEQGLLIAKPFYEAIGGHDARSTDPEAALLRRIGRRRIAVLATSAFYNR